MYIYFEVVVYMGIYKEPAIKDYWKKGSAYTPKHPIG